MTTYETKDRIAIDREVLDWIKESPWRDDETRFNALAKRIFHYQFENCKPYARFATGRDILPETVKQWQDIPAVPTGAFKEMTLSSFPKEETIKIFQTSGTSSQKQGKLHLDTLMLYEASLMASLQHLLLFDLKPKKATLRILAPSAQESPDSSLSHMFSKLMDEFGSDESDFDVVNGELKHQRLIDYLQSSELSSKPIVLCGTAFSFVHMLDALTARNLQIACPPGSRIMETGGFKGRSRELTQDDLHQALEGAFGIPRHRIVNQYGMTELGSQFYDSVLIDPKGPRRKLVPPWVRVRFIDPETSEEVEEGQTGITSILDLSNTGSISAIQTADLGRKVHASTPGFTILGREQGAEERGCSIAADEMLSS